MEVLKAIYDISPVGEDKNREPLQIAQQVVGETEVLPHNLVMQQIWGSSPWVSF